VIRGSVHGFDGQNIGVLIHIGHIHTEKMQETPGIAGGVGAKPYFQHKPFVRGEPDLSNHWHCNFRLC
jgi:hypothetical protein